MAQTSGTGDAASVNIELNIVPFIDLMSCLTVFLLATAVWISIAQLEIRPAGRGADVQTCLDGPCDEPRISLLVTDDALWVGVSRLEEIERIPRLAADHDWARLETALRGHKASSLFDGKTAIEIAAESTPGHPIAYQALIAAMDVAVKAGFVDVGVSDPAGLTVRPR